MELKKLDLIKSISPQYSNTPQLHYSWYSLAAYFKGVS